jgi:hypothetical protein
MVRPNRHQSLRPIEPAERFYHEVKALQRRLNVILKEMESHLAAADTDRRRGCHQELIDPRSGRRFKDASL